MEKDQVVGMNTTGFSYAGKRSESNTGYECPNYRVKSG